VNTFGFRSTKTIGIQGEKIYTHTYCNEVHNPNVKTPSEKKVLNMINWEVLGGLKQVIRRA